MVSTASVADQDFLPVRECVLFEAGTINSGIHYGGKGSMSSEILITLCKSSQELSKAKLFPFFFAAFTLSA
jgi:hypothetical protein